jgi:hypothetical protein
MPSQVASAVKPPSSRRHHCHRQQQKRNNNYNYNNNNNNNMSSNASLLCRTLMAQFMKGQHRLQMAAPEQHGLISS